MTSFGTPAAEYDAACRYLGNATNPFGSDWWISSVELEEYGAPSMLSADSMRNAVGRGLSLPHFPKVNCVLIASTVVYGLATANAADVVMPRLGDMYGTGLVKAWRNSFDSVAVERPSPIATKLDHYRSLLDGWAGSEALAPGDAAIERAAALNRLAETSEWPPLRCYVSADGEVGLVWKSEDGYANVGFWNDGSLVYFARPVGGGSEVRGDMEAQDSVPDELLKVLSTFI